jgi:hypothetical protein
LISWFYFWPEMAKTGCGWAQVMAADQAITRSHVMGDIQAPVNSCNEAEFERRFKPDLLRGRAAIRGLALAELLILSKAGAYPP